jgi:hypothetical protein
MTINRREQNESAKCSRGGNGSDNSVCRIDKKDITVRIVSTFEESQMVTAIRAAVYLGEEDGKYEEHFDRNDFCSTLLLALVNGEPVGTMRCRWYAEFARFEKLAVRKQYRSFHVLTAIVSMATRISRKKGYTRVTGMALPQVVPFWVRKGGLKPGQPFQTQYGLVVPLAGPLPEVPGIDALNFDKAGNEDFERTVYDWEGAGL